MSFSDNLKELSDLIVQYMGFQTTESVEEAKGGRSTSVRYISDHGEDQSFVYASDGGAPSERIIYFRIPSDDKKDAREYSIIDLRLRQDKFKVKIATPSHTKEHLLDLVDSIPEYEPSVGEDKSSLSFEYPIDSQVDLKTQLEPFKIFLEKYLKKITNR